jgi:hypothetical protein
VVAVAVAGRGERRGPARSGRSGPRHRSRAGARRDPRVRGHPGPRRATQDVRGGGRRRRKRPGSRTACAGEARARAFAGPLVRGFQIEPGITRIPYPESGRNGSS